MISEELYERAVKVIPAGVTRPFRFFEPYPFYAEKAYGSRLVDFDGREYLDHWMGHGALVLGHMHPSIVEATKEQLKLGFHFGVCNEWEVRLAEQVAKLVPSVEMIRFNNSGTEANMHAVRLARAYTGRDRIGKFEGHYHGEFEPLSVAAGWPLSYRPESAGYDPNSLKNTIVLPFNDLEAISRIVKKRTLSCVIIDALVVDGVFPADKEFLKGLREVCDNTGTLLIFDEVVTGFRLAPGGAQEVFGVIPDMTTFGKAIGGGEFPVGALGGKMEIMEWMNPLKHPKKSEFVQQGGTYSGNPLVMRSGYEATREYEKRNVYTHIGGLGEKLARGLQNAVRESKANAHVTAFGSMVKLHFLKGKVNRNDLRSLRSSGNKEMEKKYFHYLISNGILAMTPGDVHFYVSLPHTDEEIEKTITVTEEFLKSQSVGGDDIGFE